jgi:ribonucleoside-diphosphate reductase alpha chain
VLAPTGTIGFMMDCDTTGRRARLLARQVKKLVGGGEITIVNQTVPMALASSATRRAQVDEIVAYIDEHGTRSSARRT